MILAVCGGRDFRKRVNVFKALDGLYAAFDITKVIEGGQRTTERGYTVGGVDFWAQQWAEERGVPWLTVEADWSRWGSAAGPIRNEAILRDHRPDMLAAFPGGEGTKDMVDRARLGRFHVVEFDWRGLVVPADLQ